MKPISFVCFFILIYHSSFAQRKNQVAERHIKIITQHIIDNRKEIKSEKLTFTRYDKKGNVIEQMEFNEDSTISKWEKYNFNKNGDQIFFQELDQKGKQKRKIIDVYDAFGNNTEARTYNSQDSLTEKSIYTYNNFNDKISETIYDKDDKLKSKEVYEYESKGMIKSKMVYNADNKIIYTRTYKYDYK